MVKSICTNHESVSLSGRGRRIVYSLVFFFDQGNENKM